MKLSFGPAAWRRRWVDRAAGRIRDPIARLRFLKMMAPRVPAPKRKPGWKPWAAAVLGTAGGLGMLLPVASRPQWGIAPAENPEAPIQLPATRSAPAEAPPEIWLVDKSTEMETYSNGLQIDARFTAGTHRRSYLAFPTNGGPPVLRAEPVGIVFHSTESPQAPFEASANGRLKRIGESLLEYVRRKQAYNFVIDRFGRVFRVVPEEDAANHSGHSAWADRDWSYVNLNESFIAIAFEAGSPRPAHEAQINQPQMRSAGILLEWLRARYRIAAANCVVHAQVSVNPSAMLVGVHVDWAAGFPFEQIGLPDNYVLPLPAVWAYGFDCDANFTDKAGSEMRTGIEAARAVLAARSADNGLSPEQYRKTLRRRYRAMSAAVQNPERLASSRDSH